MIYYAGCIFLGSREMFHSLMEEHGLGDIGGRYVNDVATPSILVEYSEIDPEVTFSIFATKSYYIEGLLKIFEDVSAKDGAKFIYSGFSMDGEYETLYDAADTMDVV